MNKKILLCLSMLSLSMMGCQKDDLKVKEDQFTFNYGDSIPNDVTYYIDADKDILKDTKIKLGKLNKTNEFAKAGKYQIIAKHEKEEEKINIVIKDEVKPVISTNSVTVEEGTSEKKMLTYIESYDPIKDTRLPLKTKIKDAKKLNLNKIGTYSIEVESEDLNGNKTSKTVEVKVEKKLKKLVCDLKDSGNDEIDYQYECLFDNDKLIGEIVIVKIHSKSELSNYLAMSKDVRNSFIKEIKNNLKLDSNDDSNITYKNDNGELEFRIKLNKKQLEKLMKIDVDKFSKKEIIDIMKKNKELICR